MDGRIPTPVDGSSYCVILVQRGSNIQGSAGFRIIDSMIIHDILATVWLYLFL